MRQGSKQYHEHFDLAEECSALELVPAPWQIETTHFRYSYSAPGARTLLSCSMFSTLYILFKKKIPSCCLLALMETLQRTWKSHLAILCPAFKKGGILAGATEGS